MTPETNERHKTFANGKKPSMKRRAVEHDYHQRSIYMITIAVEGRRSLLGRLEGDVTAERGTPDAPHVVPTALGMAVEQAWNDIPKYHPEVSTIAFQLMPDHIHGILFVERDLKEGLGKVVLGFKQGCNKAYRSLMAGCVGYVAEVQQHTGQERAERQKGLLFERGYHDRILLRAGQLDTMRAYLADNPYRLAIKRTRPELLRVNTNVDICGCSCSAVGNMALLQAPKRLQVRISRSISPALLAEEQHSLLTAAQEGAILVSPAISPGEKALMRAAFNAKLPLIVLLANGLDPMSKPSGERFYATAEGRLLLISPFPHHGNNQHLTRHDCELLNALAWNITHTNNIN